MNIKIIHRDINGKTTVFTTNAPHTISFNKAYSYAIKATVEHAEDVILFVSIDQACAYSALTDEPIDWEDLIGFFA